MGPLIEITNVPIEIEMKVSHAKLEYTRGTAELEISRDNGGLSIKSRPIRLNIDTFEARNSVVPTAVRSIQQSAEKGRQAAYQATATYAQQGELLLKTQIGEELVTQFAADAAAKDVKTNIGIQFLPSVGPELDWDPGEVNIRFEMDKLKIAVTKLAMLAERQINYLFHDRINGILPPFVNMGVLGLNYGLQASQFTATSTTAECQTLSNPMYVHSIPNNNDNQDIVSMGTNSALLAKNSHRKCLSGDGYPDDGYCTKL